MLQRPLWPFFGRQQVLREEQEQLPGEKAPFRGDVWAMSRLRKADEVRGQLGQQGHSEFHKNENRAGHRCDLRKKLMDTVV